MPSISPIWVIGWLLNSYLEPYGERVQRANKQDKFYNLRPHYDSSGSVKPEVLRLTTNLSVKVAEIDSESRVYRRLSADPLKGLLLLPDKQILDEIKFSFSLETQVLAKPSSLNVDRDAEIERKESVFLENLFPEPTTHKEQD
jgi:hypothetical protein